MGSREANLKNNAAALSSVIQLVCVMPGHGGIRLNNRLRRKLQRRHPGFQAKMTLSCFG